jgi:hypothetical protein
MGILSSLDTVRLTWEYMASRVVSPEPSPKSYHMYKLCALANALNPPYRHTRPDLSMVEPQHNIRFRWSTVVSMVVSEAGITLNGRSRLTRRRLMVEETQNSTELDLI